MNLFSIGIILTIKSLPFIATEPNSYGYSGRCEIDYYPTEMADNYSDPINGRQAYIFYKFRSKSAIPVSHAVLGSQSFNIGTSPELFIGRRSYYQSSLVYKLMDQATSYLHVETIPFLIYGRRGRVLCSMSKNIDWWEERKRLSDQLPAALIYESRDEKDLIPLVDTDDESLDFFPFSVDEVKIMVKCIAKILGEPRISSDVDLITNENKEEEARALIYSAQQLKLGRYPTKFPSKWDKLIQAVRSEQCKDINAN